jgi:nucleotide-binding universal stress UspA family protein
MVGRRTLVVSLPCILVGTDFSAGAAAALAEARRIAAPLGLELAVVHVVEGYGAGTWRAGGEAERWLADGAVRLDDLVVRSGLPWIELVREAERTGAAMLVVGSHGRSGFQPVALGSTATRLGILSPRPVLLVNPRAVRETEPAAAGA